MAKCFYCYCHRNEFGKLDFTRQTRYSNEKRPGVVAGGNIMGNPGLLENQWIPTVLYFKKIENYGACYYIL